MFRLAKLAPLQSGRIFSVGWKIATHCLELTRACRAPDVSFLLFALVFLAGSLLCGAKQVAQAQEISKDSNGLNVLEAGNLRLVTDLEIDSELKGWPQLLDQAMHQWRAVFSPSAAKTKLPKPTVYVVGDKKLWSELGLFHQIPSRQLQDGVQIEDELFVANQLSPYYRRLLFLHEATHWIMYRWQGAQGAPWLAEGMADYLGTHEIKNGRLKLGIIPASPKDVPHWGRIKLIQDTIRSKQSPKLSEIMSFPDMLEHRMERYSWSWAATVFFATHPQFQKDFEKLYQGPLDFGFASTDHFYRALEQEWPGLSIQWRSFVDELDYGMDPKRASLVLAPQLFSDNARGITKPSFTLQAQSGWQAATGILEAGTKITVKANGKITIRTQSSSVESLETLPWESTPRGISVEYHRSLPLGCVAGVWAATNSEQPSLPWDQFYIGEGAELPIPSEPAILLLRINEKSEGLADNQGHYSIQLQQN